jgi:3-deoxy-D-manno-octulosonic acid (KDO) 8-phosphate synthase
LFGRIEGIGITSCRGGSDGWCERTFLEVHPEPDKSLCAGPNMIETDEVDKIQNPVKVIYDSAKAILLKEQKLLLSCLSY